MADYVAMATADSRGITLWIRQGTATKAVHYGGKRTHSPEFCIEHSSADLDEIVSQMQTQFPTAVIALENLQGLVTNP